MIDELATRVKDDFAHARLKAFLEPHPKHIGRTADHAAFLR